MAKIKMVQLLNCQSWKEGILEFSSGLNIIKANNNSEGKSVFQKMLDITGAPQTYTKDSRKALISYGANCAQMNILFDDDSLGSVSVYPDKVEYRYAENANAENLQFEQTIDYPHPVFLRKLNLIVSYETGVVVNSLRGKGNMFLVTTDNKTNHEILKDLTSHEKLTHLIELFKNKIPEMSRNRSTAEVTANRLERKLETSQKVDVVALEDEINKLEFYTSAYRNVLKVYSLIDDIEINEMLDYESILAQLDFCKSIEDSGMLDLEVKDYVEIDDNLINLISFASDLETYVGDLKPVQNDITVEEIKEIDLCIKLEDVLNTFPNKIPTTDIDMQDIFSDIKLLEDLDNISEYINEITQLKGTIDKNSKVLAQQELYLELFDIVSEVDKAVYNLQVIKGNLDNSTQQLKQIESTMKDLCRDNKQLPCGVHGAIVYIDNKCIPVIKECVTNE